VIELLAAEYQVVHGTKYQEENILLVKTNNREKILLRSIIPCMCSLYNALRSSSIPADWFEVVWDKQVECKIWRLHDDDFEVYRLMGYKNPDPISQETYHFSATEPSQLILCKILRFQGGDYEECRILGRYTVWLL
jgi:hypothetical protein